MPFVGFCCRGRKIFSEDLPFNLFMMFSYMFGSCLLAILRTADSGVRVGIAAVATRTPEFTRVIADICVPIQSAFSCVSCRKTHNHLLIDYLLLLLYVRCSQEPAKTLHCVAIKNSAGHKFQCGHSSQKTQNRESRTFRTAWLYC